MLPAYSVIVPVYNSEDTLEQAVLSAVGQSYPPREILLIDDGSSDGSWALILALAERYPLVVRPLRNSENLGVAASRNRGFLEALSPIVALLDADDWWEQDKSRLQLELMSEAGCGFSYTGYVPFVGETGVEKNSYPVPDRLDFNEMLVENYVGCSTVMLRSELVKKYQMDGNFAHEDYYYWMVLLRNGVEARGLNLPLVHYRLGRGSRSSNKWQAAKNRWRIFRDGLGLGLGAAVVAFVSYGMRGIKKRV